MAKRRELEAFTSPIGEAIYPWLSTPDVQHDPNGTFHVDLACDPTTCEDFVAKLEAARDTFAEAELTAAQRQSLQCREVYRMEMTRPDKDASEQEKKDFVPEPTGRIIFRTKLKAKVQNPKTGETWEQKPIVVDLNGEKVIDPVYTGSIVRIRGQVVPYAAAGMGIYGVTLRLKAVQVHELVTGSENSWADFGDE